MQFCDGCILAYERSVHIPFVAVQQDSMEYLKDNKNIIQYVDFPVISKQGIVEG